MTISAVIDTNLIVGYLLTQRPPLTELMAHWQNRSFVLITSPQIVAEMRAVLQRPALRARLIADPRPLLTLIEADAIWTAGQIERPGACRDPKDDKFLACAVEAQATYLVTRDQDLLELGAYEATTILKPEPFLLLLDAQLSQIPNDDPC